MCKRKAPFEEDDDDDGDDSLSLSQAVKYCQGCVQNNEMNLSVYTMVTRSPIIEM